MGKFLKAGYYVWSAISLILIVVYIVVNFGFEKPKTVGTQYFDDIKINSNIKSDNIIESSTLPIFEVNVARSETNPDLNLYEVVITEYTDFEAQSYKRYGMQVLGDYSYCTLSNISGKTTYNHASFLSITASEMFENNYISIYKDIYFYELDSSGTLRHMESQEEFDRCLDSLQVTAGGINYKLEVGGPDAQYTYKHEYTSTKGWNAWNELFNITKTEEITRDYNCVDLFHYLISSFNTGKNDKGSHVFKNLDIDRFLSIQKMNGSTQYYSINDFTDNNAYFNVRFTNKNIEGFLSVEDSIIGSISYDANYSSGIANKITNAYSFDVSCELNEYYFTPVYNKVVDGYVLTLSDSFVDYLLSLNNFNLSCSLNVSNVDENIIGLDISSLSKLKLGVVYFKANSQKTFYVVGDKGTTYLHSLSSNYIDLIYLGD